MKILIIIIFIAIKTNENDNFIEIFEYLNFYHGKYYFNSDDIPEHYINLYGEIKRTGINWDAIIKQSENIEKLILWFNLSFNKFVKNSNTLDEKIYDQNQKYIDLLGIFFSTFDVFRIKSIFIESNNTNIEETKKEENILNLRFNYHLNVNYYFLIGIEYNGTEYIFKLKIYYWDNTNNDFINKSFEKIIKFINKEEIRSKVFSNLYIVINENEILNNLIFKNFKVVKNHNFEDFDTDNELIYYYPTKKLIEIDISDFYTFDNFLLNKLNNEHFIKIDNKNFLKYIHKNSDGTFSYLAQIKTKMEIFNYNLFSNIFELNIVKISLFTFNDKNFNIHLTIDGNDFDLQNAKETDFNTFLKINKKKIISFFKKIKIGSIEYMDLYIKFNFVKNIKIEIKEETNDSYIFFNKLQYFKGKIDLDIDSNYLSYKKVGLVKFDLNNKTFNKIDQTNNDISLYEFKNYNFLTFYKIEFDLKNNSTLNKSINIEFKKLDNNKIKNNIITNQLSEENFEFFGTFVAKTYDNSPNEKNDYNFNILNNDINSKDFWLNSGNLKVKIIEYFNYYYYDLLNKKLFFSLDCKDIFDDENIYLNYHYNNNNEFEYECVKDISIGKTFKLNTNILYSCGNNCDECVEVFDNKDKFIKLKCNKCINGFNNLNGICILNIDLYSNNTYEKASNLKIGLNILSVYNNIHNSCKISNSKICLIKFYNNDNSFNYPLKYKNTYSEFEFNILNPEKNFNLIVFECINENDIFKNNKCQNCKENGGEVCKNLQILQCEYNKIKGNFNECINGNIENCFKFSDDNKCLECDDGYKVNKEQKCEKCSLECEECNNEGCLKCKDGFFLELKKCFKCVDDNALSCKSANISYECNSDYILNKDFKCVKCLSHEEDIKMSNCEGECLNFNYCKKCIKNYFQNENNICTKCEINNCIDCLDFNNCKECNEKYFLFNGKCIECNYPCKTCSSEKNCFECEKGYLLNVKTFICEKCNVTICKKCHNIYSYCISCFDGFYLDKADNICKRCDKNCLNCINLRDNCISCNKNFVLKSKKKDDNKKICIKYCIKKNYFYNLKLDNCIDCEPNFEKEGNNYFLKKNIILLIKPSINFELNKKILNDNIKLYYLKNKTNKINFNYELKKNAFLITPTIEFKDDVKIFFEINNKFINEFNDCKINTNFTKIFEIKKNEKFEAKKIKIEETHYYKNGTYKKRVNYFNDFIINKTDIMIYFEYFLIIFHNIYYLIGIILFIKKPIIISSYLNYYLMLKLYLCFIFYFNSFSIKINEIDYFFYQINIYKIFYFPNDLDLKNMNNNLIKFTFPKLSNIKNPSFLNISINTILLLFLIIFKIIFSYIKNKMKITNIKSNKIVNQDESKIKINNNDNNNNNNNKPVNLYLNFFTILKLNFSFFLNNLILITLILEFIDKIFDIIFYLKPKNFDYMNFYFFLNNIFIFLTIILIIIFYNVIIFKGLLIKKKIKDFKLDFNKKYWKIVYLNKLFNYHKLKNIENNIKIIINKFNFIIIYSIFNILFFENFIIKSLITFLIGFYYYYSFNYNKKRIQNLRIVLIFMILLIRNIIELHNYIIYLFYGFLFIFIFTFFAELVYYIWRIIKKD